MNVALGTGQDRNLSAISLISILMVMDVMHAASAYGRSITDFWFINICQVVSVVDERLFVNYDYYLAGRKEIMLLVSLLDFSNSGDGILMKFYAWVGVGQESSD